MNRESYHCPLCNGYSNYSAICPRCRGNMVDYGPVSYLLASYSPYRPIDEMKLNDGRMDLKLHQCPHEVYCPNCGYDQVVMIAER
jgi:hypothetical protein